MNKMTSLAVALLFTFGLTACTTAEETVSPTVPESTPTLITELGKQPLSNASSNVPAVKSPDTTKLDAVQEASTEAALQQTNLLKQQIRMLERAVSADTPEKAIDKWAEAIYTRNGALQYAMIYPDNRAKHLKVFEESSWITGTSSPWMERYRISKGTKQSDGSYLFKVQFDYRTSEDMDKKIGWEDIDSFDRIVRKSDEYWYVVE